VTVTDGARRRDELKAFLRARREGLSPALVGLPSGPRRRTPGLRREEVAALADVGVTWYTWLEQGRAISASQETIGRIGSALALDSTDMAYLFSLAGALPPRETPAPVAVDAHLAGVLGSVAAPALVLNARLDVLAFNPLANELFRFGDSIGPFARNNAWRFFMDPARRELYVEWEEIALRTVGVLRAHHANRVGEPAFEALVQAMRESDDFVRLWNQGRTAALDTVEMRLRHPRFGNLRVATVRFLLPTDPDGFLSIFSPIDAETAAAFASFTSP
jgi:transcriptional regulator with XRE-family HTH domain